MSNSLQVFATFRDSLTQKEEFINGDESFTAKIIYKWHGQTQQETLTVKLSLTTFEYGQVHIDEGKKINSHNVHMDFNHYYQEYFTSNDGFLIIKGKNSPKIGDYEVIIIPI